MFQADKGLPNLESGELFNPAPNKKTEIFSTPTARAPLQNEEYVLQQTPYICNLRLAMEQALNRPITYYNSQRHNLMLKYVELIFFPVLLVGIYIAFCSAVFSFDHSFSLLVLLMLNMFIF